jgi:uncharacterized protein
MEPNTKSFLGRGWSFPPRFDAGGIALSAREEKIAQSIRIILGTAPGERVMRPDFGCGINRYVFEVVNASVLNGIRQAVREALILWEPRIEVLGVEVREEEFGGQTSRGTLLVSIDYRVRATNSTLNLVYPFFLRGG